MTLHRWPNLGVPWGSFQRHWALPGGEPQPHLTVREWAEPIEVGAPLPALPLFLRADQLWVMVDLESTYRATLQAGRYTPT